MYNLGSFSHVHSDFKVNKTNWNLYVKNHSMFEKLHYRYNTAYNVKLPEAY